MANKDDTHLKSEPLESALHELKALHGSVDESYRQLAEHHRSRLQCRRGCATCCQDDLSVLQIEAENIRRAAKDLLANGVPHPTGACAFLDRGGACRIYLARPYICRTQGLPLRWYEATDDDDYGEDQAIVERRDICPLNLEGPEITLIPDEYCWLLGPVEEELSQLTQRMGESPQRIPLRSLFADPS